ncbi:TetR-like C-terminal domain-containing protein [Streptomyces sp. NPDC050704]|uniref:TetR-like C-terminal domain-containing protein n=1 Tax=Streptomyces sp. NPDC050704 TaxID=3157219 RepID=UPI003438FEEC
MHLGVPADPPARALADVLVSQVGAPAGLFRDPAVGPLVADLVAAAQADPDIRQAVDEHWIRPRRDIAAHLLHEAVGRGEPAPGTDVPVAVDQLFAPVHHRLLLGHEPLHEELATVLVGQLPAGLRPGRHR